MMSILGAPDEIASHDEILAEVANAATALLVDLDRLRDSTVTISDAFCQVNRARLIAALTAMENGSI